MDTLQLKKLLESKNIYNGIYALDELPTKIQKQFPTGIIINLDKSYQPGSHWVALYISKQTSNEYFDSFGIPPLENSIVNLLKQNYIYNNVQLQNSHTTVCGQYCIFYLWKKSHGWSLKQIVNVFGKDTLENDHLVNEIIEFNFDIDLNVLDYQFIKKQSAVPMSAFHK